MKQIISNFEESSIDLIGFSNQLESLITAQSNLVDGGLVISLSAPYGFGKSTFIRMWEDKNRDSDAIKLLTINAWESDYQVSPLLVILASFYQNLQNETENNQELWEEIEEILEKQSMVDYFGSFFASMIDQSLKAVKIPSIIEAIFHAKKTSPIKKILKEFNEFQSTFSSLKAAIDKLGKHSSKKLVIVIDELDRCRPDYAINYLEVIKHFFDIENLTFILAVDFQQLENSAKKMFGQDLNCDEYFRKFFYRRVALPKIKPNAYLNIFEKFLTESHPVELKSTLQSDLKANEILGNYYFSSILDTIYENKVTPRQLHEISRVVNDGFITSKSQRLFIFEKIALLALSFLKVTHPKVYRDIANQSADPEKIHEIFRNSFGNHCKSNWDYKGTTGYGELWVFLFTIFESFNQDKNTEYWGSKGYPTDLDSVRQSWEALIQHHHGINIKQILELEPRKYSIKLWGKSLRKICNQLDFLIDSD